MLPITSSGLGGSVGPALGASRVGGRGNGVFRSNNNNDKDHTYGNTYTSTSLKCSMLH